MTLSCSPGDVLASGDVFVSVLRFKTAADLFTSITRRVEAGAKVTDSCALQYTC